MIPHTLIEQPMGMYAVQNAATMFVFSPRQQHVQAPRPLLYNIPQNFIDRASDRLAKTATGNPQQALSTLADAPDVPLLVTPSMTPNIIDLRSFSDHYTFALIVDDVAPLGPLGVRTAAPTTKPRLIYYGYFIGEPFNPVFHSSHITINPQAQLVITHRTQIHTAHSYMPTGVHTKIAVRGDENLVQPSTLDVLSGGGLHLMKPDLLHKNMAFDPSSGMGISALGVMTGLGGLHREVPLATTLEAPREHMRHLLTAVGASYATMMAQAHSSRYVAPEVEGLREDCLESLVQQSLEGFNPFQSTPWGTGDILTMEVLEKRYPGGALEVKPFILPRTTLYCPTDQTSVGPQNAMASLLTTAVPGMLADKGLAYIDFRYDSYSGERTINDVTSLVPMPQEELAARLEGFWHELMSGLFQVIKMGPGDFNLLASFSVGGVNRVILNLYAMDHRMTDPFEVPSMLGAATGLLGAAEVAQHNAQELHHLIDNLTGGAALSPPADHYAMQVQSGYDGVRHQPPVAAAPAPAPAPFPTITPATKNWV